MVVDNPVDLLDEMLVEDNLKGMFNLVAKKIIKIVCHLLGNILARGRNSSHILQIV